MLIISERQGLGTVVQMEALQHHAATSAEAYRGLQPRSTLQQDVCHRSTPGPIQTARDCFTYKRAQGRPT